MHEVPIEPRHPDGFAELIAPRDLRRFQRALADAGVGLAGRTWWHVNSTADGGGVAELLHALLGTVASAGVRTRWLVIDGDPVFFEVTKRIHNRLHGAPGDGGPLGAAERAVYDTTIEHELPAIAELVGPGDVVVLHDPQTAGLAPWLGARGVHVVWVCHVGIDTANDLARSAWAFLLDDVRTAAAVVFTRAAYVWDGIDPTAVAIIPPCIDAGSPKNVPIEHPTVEAVLAAAGVMEAPLGDPTVPLGDGTSVRVERTGRDARGGAGAGDRAPRRSGLSMGPTERSDRGAQGVRRGGPPRYRRPPGAGRPEGRRGLRRPRGRRGPGRGRRRLARLATRGPGARAPRQPSGGRPHRERRGRERAAATRRRRGAEEPGRGLRPHRHRGDVEGTTRRRRHASAASPSRSNTAAAACSWTPPT